MSKQRDRIAKIIAREYWRGRIESEQKSSFEEGVFQRMAEEAGETDYHRFSYQAKLIEEILSVNDKD